jgi:hypothetical protein
MMLIYKTNMHPGSTLNPEQCTSKVDRNARKRWLTTTLQQLDQHQDTTIPPPEHEQVEEMQKEQQATPQQQGDDLPPSGSETTSPAQTTRQQELNGSRAPAPQDQQVPTRLSFANPEPPMISWEIIGTRANKASNAPVAPAKGTEIPLKNRYEPIAEHGSVTNDRYNERLSFGSLS